MSQGNSHMLLVVSPGYFSPVSLAPGWAGLGPLCELLLDPPVTAQTTALEPWSHSAVPLTQREVRPMLGVRLPCCSQSSPLRSPPCAEREAALFLGAQLL